MDQRNGMGEVAVSEMSDKAGYPLAQPRAPHKLRSHAQAPPTARERAGCWSPTEDRRGLVTDPRRRLLGPGPWRRKWWQAGGKVSDGRARSGRREGLKTGNL